MSEEIKQREIDIAGWFAVYHPKNFNPVAIFPTEREAKAFIKQMTVFSDQYEILEIKRADSIELSEIGARGKMLEGEEG